MPRISPIYPLPVSMGGTGQTTAAAALGALNGLANYATRVDPGTSVNSLPWGVWWGDMADGPTGRGWQQIVSIGDYQLSYVYRGNTTAPDCYLRGKVNGVWQPWAKLNN